jgi:poly-gamma-glutamate synthesis protein (capsule biosynthesis protein)
MQAAIADLRRNADVIVVSHHWGRAGLPAILTDYERILGHASIDAGANIVLGHHHHFLRGIELYRGKPIFYGLGHFVFDLPGLENALTEDEIQKLNEMGEYAIYPRDGYPLSPFHPDARMTMIATCDFTGKELRSVGFVPCLLNGASNAIPLPTGSIETVHIADYMREITTAANLPTRYVVAGARVDQFSQFRVVI